jgi:hypothetical protein
MLPARHSYWTLKSAGWGCILSPGVLVGLAWAGLAGVGVPPSRPPWLQADSGSMLSVAAASTIALTPMNFGMGNLLTYSPYGRIASRACYLKLLYRSPPGVSRPLDRPGTVPQTD